MNKEELIKAIDDLEVEDMSYYNGDMWYLPREHNYINKYQVLSLIERLEESDILKTERVKIPQFVADFIKGAKGKINLLSALNPLYDKHLGKFSEDRTLNRWLEDNENQELFARAWLDRYEVEQGQLYTVTLANGTYLYKHHESGALIFDECGAFNNFKILEHNLTQSEIESVDPILMQIAKEVE